MLEIPEVELLPISEFRMAWRFNRHPDKSRLRCLTESGVDRIGPFTRAGLASLVDGHWRAVPEVETIDATDDSVAQQWLSNLGLGNGRIIVHWVGGGTADAVLTDAEFFISNWSDFCYPSSDDVIILPESLEWSLAYWHEELLYFKRLDKR